LARILLWRRRPLEAVLEYQVRYLRITDALVPGLAAVLMAGCASNAGPSCLSSSLDCLMQKAQQPYIQTCVDDLYWYPHRDKQARQAIDARYGYPATSADTFFDLQRMGVASVPSPNQWCKHYAARKVAVRIGSGR
jgi:hypothetical protein